MCIALELLLWKLLVEEVTLVTKEKTTASIFSIGYAYLLQVYIASCDSFAFFSKYGIAKHGLNLLECYRESYVSFLASKDIKTNP